jgi:sugar-specific transcriptional regulator TrmB
MAIEESIETLKYFGLSPNQAKVYLNIGSTRFFSVNDIQKKAEVPRQEIYRILFALEEFGLVEKTVDRPILFRGIPFKQGVSFLLTKRVQETKKMVKKAEEMIEKFLPINNCNNSQEVKPNFILVPKNEPSITKRQEEIDNAETEIDFISSWKRFPREMYIFRENIKNALGRGVKIRVILEKPENMDQIPEVIKEFKKNPKYELNFIHKPPKAIVGIFDKKRALIKTSASAGLAEAPTLWTNNPCFVSVLSDFFEFMWMGTFEYEMENIFQEYVPYDFEI